jgi:hypothetical protein
MEQKIKANSEQKGRFLKEIKENIKLIEYKGELFIHKGKRDKERNILEKLRFTNEKRIYKALDEGIFLFLKFPTHKIDPVKGILVLEYVNKSDEFPVEKKDFISAYLELQKIQPAYNPLLDFYNQTFRGFFYRTFCVSFITLRKKVNFRIALETMLLLTSLNLKENKLSKKYWIHGDLNENNYFNTSHGDLYFIDFENMFYTKKWPFAEIIAMGFKFEDSIIFNPSLIFEYLNQNKNDSIVKKIDLFNQIRYASLLKSIHEIAQTKSIRKRETYTDFLKIVLNKKEFKVWYQINVSLKTIC